MTLYTVVILNNRDDSIRYEWQWVTDEELLAILDEWSDARLTKTNTTFYFFHIKE